VGFDRPRRNRAFEKTEEGFCGLACAAAAPGRHLFRLIQEQDQPAGELAA
jgi:hypothetical protein